MAREMACRKCKHVTTEKVCPACKSSDLTPDWSEFSYFDVSKKDIPNRSSFCNGRKDAYV